MPIQKQIYSEHNTNHHPTISIITVNYYCLTSIKKLLQSVKDKSSTISYETIVVSNSPTHPNKISELKKTFCHLTFIQLERNFGFSKANNIGAKHANGKFLLFLNPDTILINDILDLFVTYYDKHNNIGVIGPSTYNQNGKLVPSVKRDPTLTYLLHQSFPFITYFSKYQYRQLIRCTKVVEVLNGSALFVSYPIFKEVGGMEEKFFMYWEENDLCRRIREAGYKVLFLSVAKIKHIGGVTTQSHFINMELEKHRSKKKYFQIHAPHLVCMNRIFGIISYFWRFLFSLFTFRFHKIKQFGALFHWYSFKYE